MTKAQAKALAQEWIEAFNNHDLERILSHYTDSVELPQGVKALVPLGATVVSALPDQLQKAMTAEAKRRGDSA